MFDKQWIRTLFAIDKIVVNSLYYQILQHPAVISHPLFHFVHVNMISQEIFSGFGYYTVVEWYSVGFYSVFF